VTDDDRRTQLKAKLLEALALADVLEEHAIGAMLSTTIGQLRDDHPRV